MDWVLVIYTVGYVVVQCLGLIDILVKQFLAPVFQKHFSCLIPKFPQCVLLLWFVVVVCGLWFVVRGLGREK